METRMFLWLHVKNLHESTKMCVSMYFLHLVLTFTPHYIIMDNGLFNPHMVHACTHTHR